MKFRKKYHAPADSWALVTGAAGGIGLAFADRLASLGYNLVLADIDGARLDTAATGIATSHGIDVRTLEIDLAGPAAARELHGFCGREGIEPVVVVNNAGIFSYCDIARTDPSRIELFAALHCTATSLVCRLFGADMASRGGGYILNMSSYATWMPWPGLAMYSATKAYIRSFSLSLAAELRGTGVVVTALLPAGVTTGLYGLSPGLQRLGRRLGILLTPGQVSDRGLRAMFRGRRQYVPGVFMRLVLPVVRTLPPSVVRLARRKTLKFQK